MNSSSNNNCFGDTMWCCSRPITSAHWRTSGHRPANGPPAGNHHSPRTGYTAGSFVAFFFLWMKLVSFYLIIILTQESTVEAAKETSTTAATGRPSYYAHTHTHEIIQECWLCWEWNPRMRPRISQADKLFEKLTSPDEHTLPPPTKFMSGKL